MNRATLFFSLGQHAALNAISASLLGCEKFFAFLNDLYVVCQPHRVLDVHQLMSTKLWAHIQDQSSPWDLPKGMQTFAGNGNIVEPQSKGVERRPVFANSTARSRCVGDTFGSRRFCEISPRIRARRAGPDSITSIVPGRARTPECFTMSSWSSLGEVDRRN